MLIALVIFVVVILGVLGIASTRPDTFRVERRLAIQAPADTVFAYLSDFHAWAGWSPWEKLDPAMKRRYEGADSGVGSAYAWEGNAKVGSGRMELMECTAPAKLVIKLDFLAPFEAHNTAEFTLSHSDGSTEVSWAMHGPRPFMMKVMSLFMNMDQMIGKDFEKGLANLKTVAEH